MPNAKIVLLTIPGLRRRDLGLMPHLSKLSEGGSLVSLSHHFPAVTWPSQTNMLTGNLAEEHGVIANGFFWRQQNEVEMWTAWNEKIERPQIWDLIKQQDPSIKTAAWFPMLSKGCNADFVCMPAPIHRPDGSEDLWCHTKPQEFYGRLLDKFEHFPLQHFWGPLANIKSSQWIADSFVECCREFGPDVSYIYLPHLDYQAQKFGPDSEQAAQSCRELDQLLAHLQENVESIYGSDVTWIVLSEYTIQQVDHVTYPNRVLREAGWLHTRTDDDQKELIDFETTPAWALVDHQFSHLFVRDPSLIEPIAKRFESLEGIDQVLHGDSLAAAGLAHERSGEIVLISSESSWQAYYWWEDDAAAPKFAHSVDIHRKPGYDPVEMFFDMTTKSVPLDATLIHGSHGRGLMKGEQASEDSEGILICNRELNSKTMLDTEVCELVVGLATAD